MLKKKKILLASLAGISVISIPTIVATSVLLNKEKNNLNLNSKYSFLDNTFNSKQDALDYANLSASRFSRTAKSPTKWSLNVNNELITFNSQKDLLKYLDNFIATKSYSSYTNEFITDGIGALVPSELQKMNFNDEIKTTTVYRGKNNSVHFTEKAAKDTYFEQHEVYYFNGIFFRTKEELSQWLEKNITNFNYDDAQKSKVYEISFQDMNKRSSLPLKVEELEKDYENNDIPASVENFVRSSSKAYFEYFSEELNKTIYVSENSLDSIASKYDANYVQVSSNQGKGNYIIDTDTNDDAELFGPYYVKSGSEILQINDKSKWRKIEGTDHSLVNEMAQKEKLSQFMNLILAQPSNQDNLSRENELTTIYEISDLQEEIDKYFYDLYLNLNSVYSSIENLYNTMKKGKRYGEFLKTPILFIHTIDQMIYYGVSQDYIDKTINFYSSICRYFDNQIYSTVPRKFLIGKNGDLFSLEKLFKISDKGLDLNYDVDTLIGQVVYEYPDLYEFAEFIIHDEMYLSKLNTLEDIHFSFNYFEKTFGLKLSKKFENEYKLVWDILNSKDLETLYKNVEKINPNLENITSYYYTNNYVMQKNSNEISKIVISYWLDKEKAKKEFNLNDSQIKQLEVIAKPSPNNESFRMNTYGFYNENYNFLKKLYKHNGSVDPILFTRLVLYMKHYDNSNKLENKFSSLLNNSRKISVEVEQFMSNEIMLDYESLTEGNCSTFTRFNFNSSSVMSSKIKIDIEESKKIESLSEKADKWIKRTEVIFNSALSLVELAINFANNSNPSDWERTQFAFSIMKLICEVGEQFSPWFKIGTIVCDLIINMNKIESFSYIFETEDVKYIWNGGMQESWFYGLIPGKSITIDDMKLLNPMQVVKPNTTNGYYYNGKIYPDLDLLKEKQLDDILKGRYSSNRLKKIYSLVELKDNDNKNIAYTNDSISSLVVSFSKHVKNLIANNLEDEDLVVKKNSFRFGSIFYDSTKTQQENIDDILNNIKPTLIAQLPVLNNTGSKYAGMPIFNNLGNLEDESVLEYNLPGHSWTAEGGNSFNKNENFIIVDQNIKPKLEEDSDNSNNESENNNVSSNSKEENDENKKPIAIDYSAILAETFYNSFNVDSKEVDSQFVTFAKTFSELSSKIEQNYCYYAIGRDGESNLFLTKNDAINWLLSEFDYTTYYIKENINTYFINGLAFLGQQNFTNWVYENIKEVK